MPLKILGRTQDQRTGTHVVYAKCGILEYLNLVGENFDEFEIQRKRVKHKAYARMKQDIMEGTLLPSITLSIKIDIVNDLISSIEDEEALEKKLGRPNQINILDGLQRTHILSDIKSDGHEFKQNQEVLIEFWLETDVKNLIYRIIVLNAGQKPMSMRHQIELLFSTTKEVLSSAVHGIEIFTERDESRRTRPLKYPLDRLALGYYSFITKSPEIEKENIIAQQLVEEDVLSGGEEKLGEQFSLYTRYLKAYAHLDEAIFDIYDADGLAWLGSENVMVSFFAAIGDFGSSTERFHRIDTALEKLTRDITTSTRDQDLLGLSNYSKAIDGFNARKTNVGYATRKLLTNVFKEYFRDEGETNLSTLWAREA